jgi:predicted dehydrogenase
MTGIAIVGLGHWGPNLAGGFGVDPRARVRRLVDVDAARLARVAARVPGARTTTRLEDALEDPEVDAVVVATPTSTHRAIAGAALLAGKHVLVEKPMAASVRECEELCALAGRAGRILMVGHVFLFNAAVRRAKAYVDEGALGRVYYLSMVRTNLGPVRADVNAAWDLASHDLSIAMHLLGAGPVSVSATGGSWLNPGIEDAVFATARFRGDVLAHLHASWLHPRKAREVVVVGERRMLTFDDMNLTEPLRLYDKGVAPGGAGEGVVDSFASFRSSIREGDIVIPRVATGEPLREECRCFLDAIERGEAPLSDGRFGLEVVRALEAISRSVAGGGREEPVLR